MNKIVFLTPRYDLPYNSRLLVQMREIEAYIVTFEGYFTFHIITRVENRIKKSVFTETYQVKVFILSSLNGFHFRHYPQLHNQKPIRAKISIINNNFDTNTTSKYEIVLTMFCLSSMSLTLSDLFQNTTTITLRS